MGCIGSTCSHNNKKLIRIIGTRKGYFYYSRYGDYLCTECAGYKGLLRIESIYLDSPDEIYLEIIHRREPLECEHKIYFVSLDVRNEFFMENNKRKVFNVAEAQCAHCTESFLVRCRFKKENKNLVISEDWERM